MECLGAIGRSNYRVSGERQHANREITNRGLVFDEEDLARSRIFVVAADGLCTGRGLRDTGEVDIERRAAVRLAMDGDESTALLHDSIHDRQPESRAFAL